MVGITMIFFGPIFKGLRLIITRHAAVEIHELGMTGWDIEEVLANGWDCSRSKRGKDKIERCLERGRKVIRAVAVLGPYSPNGLIEEAYYLIHVSVESKKKGRKGKDGE